MTKLMVAVSLIAIVLHASCALSRKKYDQEECQTDGAEYYMWGCARGGYANNMWRCFCPLSHPYCKVDPEPQYKASFVASDQKRRTCFNADNQKLPYLTSLPVVPQCQTDVEPYINQGCSLKHNPYSWCDCPEAFPSCRSDRDGQICAEDSQDWESASLPYNSTNKPGLFFYL